MNILLAAEPALAFVHPHRRLGPGALQTGHAGPSTDGLACHGDHAGPKLTQRHGKPFSRTMLRQAARDQRDTRRAAPENAFHPAPGAGCDRCHPPAAWKPATFGHGP